MASNTALTSMITRIFIITISAKKIFLTVTIVVYIAVCIAVTVRILGRLVVVFFVLEILRGLTNRPDFALDTPGGIGSSCRNCVCIWHNLASSDAISYRQLKSD